MAEKAPGQANEPSYFAEWCRVTGWHGIIDFHMTKNYLAKSFWLAVLLLSCFFAVNQSVSLILDYYSENQWVTSVSYEMTADGGLPWPNVSVCSLDLMDDAKLRRFGAPDPYLIAYVAQPWQKSFLFHDTYQADTPVLDVHNQSSVDAKENEIRDIYAQALDRHNTSSFTEVNCF